MSHSMTKYEKQKCLSLFILSLLLSIAISTVTYGQVAEKEPALSVEGEVQQILTLHTADLAKMHRMEIRATDKDEKEHHFSGFRLSDILQQAGVTLGAQLRGKNMTKYLLARSGDGYQVIFALAEIDSSFTDRTILVADQVDGHPLPTGKGPFQMVVPGEKKHARWIWGLTTLIVRSAKE